MRRKRETEKEDKKLLKDLEARLNRLTYGEDQEEISIGELKYIEKLMEKIVPMPDGDYFDAEKGVERFQEYCRQRENEETLRKVNGEPANVQKIVARRGRARGKRRVIDTKGGRIGAIAAAVLVLAVLVGGGIGVLAERDTGVFRFLSRDKSGVESVVVGDDGMSGAMHTSMTYNQMDMIPEEYLELLWRPEELPGNMHFVKAEILGADLYTRVTWLFKENDLELKIGVKDYNSDKGVYKESYEEYEFVEEITNENINYMIFRKTDENSLINYAVCFYGESTQYFVLSNITLEEIIQIAMMYAKYIFN